MITDHLGNEYRTIKEMCKEYGVSCYTYFQKADLPLEERLTREWVIDHLGNKFKSVKDMCKHWDIGYSAYNRRRNSGWSLEHALTGDIQTDVVCDHLGNTYKTTKEMCNAYGIKPSLYRKRRKRMSLECALTKPIEEKKMQCVDHLGKVYESLRKMCAVYNTTSSKFHVAQKQGNSLEQCLGIIPTLTKHSENITVGDILVIKFEYATDDNYYKCFFNNEYSIMAGNEIVNCWREKNGIRPQGELV